MKKRYPQISIAIAVAAFLAVSSAVHVYAVSDETTQETSVQSVDETQDALWKAEISDYDSSLSLVEYEEVTPSEEDRDALASATTADTDAETQKSAGTGSTAAVPNTTLASSSGHTGVDAGAATALAGAESGQFTFTTYGYGHCVGLSQNGANYYASYGGYDYQSILFHYYPGTTLVQEDPNGGALCESKEALVNLIAQIVYNEMSSTMHPEAMKAQAVATYTYIMCNGGSTRGLILKANPPQNVIDAVASVAGQALYYNGSYAMTVYGASSGGATADSRDIFGTNYPYLVSVSCEYDALYDPYYGEIKTMSVDDVRNRIQSAYGIALSANPGNWIQLEIGSSGYVRSVTIDGQITIGGYDFSNLMGLRSARFAYTCG